VSVTQVFLRQPILQHFKYFMFPSVLTLLYKSLMQQRTQIHDPSEFDRIQAKQLLFCSILSSIRRTDFRLRDTTVGWQPVSSVHCGRHKHSLTHVPVNDCTLKQNTRGHSLVQRCKRTAIEIF